MLLNLNEIIINKILNQKLDFFNIHLISKKKDEGGPSSF